MSKVDAKVYIDYESLKELERLAEIGKKAKYLDEKEKELKYIEETIEGKIQIVTIDKYSPSPTYSEHSKFINISEIEKKGFKYDELKEDLDSVTKRFNKVRDMNIFQL